MPIILIKVEGLKIYTYFDVIEIVYEITSYPMLLGIGLENEYLAVINFKKRVITLKNCDIQIIAPLDPFEGKRHVEPRKDEVMGEWDTAYNIVEDCINPTMEGEMGW